MSQPFSRLVPFKWGRVLKEWGMSHPMRLYVKGHDSELVLIERKDALSWGYDRDQYVTVRDEGTDELRPLVLRAGSSTLMTPANTATRAVAVKNRTVIGHRMVVDETPVTLVDVTVAASSTPSIGVARQWGQVGVGTPYQEFIASRPGSSGASPRALAREMQRDWEPVHVELPSMRPTFAIAANLRSHGEIWVDPEAVYYLATEDDVYELYMKDIQSLAMSITAANTGHTEHVNISSLDTGFRLDEELMGYIVSEGRPAGRLTNPILAVTRVTEVTGDPARVSELPKADASPIHGFFARRSELEQRAAPARVQRALRSVPLLTPFD